MADENEGAARRQALADELVRSRLVTDPRVAAAFRGVPRHHFLPDHPLEEVYADKAIVTKLSEDGLPISSSSQPAIMAIMLDQMNLGEGQDVLEIGAGTGYNAALIEYLVQPNGRVITIDIDRDLADTARANLERAGVGAVDVVCADGGYGCPTHAPYDAILASGGVWDISPHWLDQLREGGRIVAPLWLNALQFSIAFEKTGDRLTSRSVRPCGFMRLRGAFAGPESFIRLGPVVAAVEDSGAVGAEALRRLLDSPGSELVLATLSQHERRVFGSYLGLCSPAFIALTDLECKRLSSQFVPAILKENERVALLTGLEAKGTGPLAVTLYGSDLALIAVQDLLAEWEEQGRPSFERATITAMPLDAPSTKGAGLTIRKKWMQYRVDF